MSQRERERGGGGRIRRDRRRIRDWDTKREDKHFEEK